MGMQSHQRNGVASIGSVASNFEIHPHSYSGHTYHSRLETPLSGSPKNTSPRKSGSIHESWEARASERSSPRSSVMVWSGISFRRLAFDSVMMTHRSGRT